MPTTDTPPPPRAARPAGGVWAAAVVDALTQVRGQFTDGWRTLHQPRSWGLGYATLAMAWMVGVIGDALTTLTLTRDPLVVEENPAAVAMMATIGVEGWVLASVAVCAGLAVGSFGRVRGGYARLLLGLTLLVVTTKVLVTLHNFAVWVSLSR